MVGDGYNYAPVRPSQDLATQGSPFNEAKMSKSLELLNSVPEAPKDGDELRASKPSVAALELLALRRSTLAREMVDPGPTDKELMTLLRIAARVPDHGKLGPWRFLIFKGSARAAFGDKLAAIFKEAQPEVDEERLEMERQRFTRAPVVVAVISKTQPHPKAPEWEQILSCGAACQNLLLAANASGYAAQWITEWLAYDKSVDSVLALGEGERVAGYIYIGSAKSQPTERRRANLEDRISYWTE